MNKEDIMSILPHREDMLLLDEVENRDGVAIGHYTVRGDEFFLRVGMYFDERSNGRRKTAGLYRSE